MTKWPGKFLGRSWQNAKSTQLKGFVPAQFPSQNPAALISSFLIWNKGWKTWPLSHVTFNNFWSASKSKLFGRWGLQSLRSAERIPMAPLALVPCAWKINQSSPSHHAGTWCANNARHHISFNSARCVAWISLEPPRPCSCDILWPQELIWKALVILLGALCHQLFLCMFFSGSKSLTIESEIRNRWFGTRSRVATTFECIQMQFNTHKRSVGLDS